MTKNHIVQKLVFGAICLFSVSMTSPSYGDIDNRFEKSCQGQLDICKNEISNEKNTNDLSRRDSACGAFWGGRGPLGTEGMDWCKNNWNTYPNSLKDGWNLCVASAKNLSDIGGCKWQ